MHDALHVFRLSVRDYWEEFVVLVMLNLVWTLAVILPLLPVLLLNDLDWFLVLALSLSLALPLPVVSGGLCFVTNQISREKTINWVTFVEGLRRYWAKSLLVAAINVVVLVLWFVNLQFYGVLLEGSWTTFALIAWLIVGIYWLLAQVFWFPMILELESERVFLALRNALAMVFVTPGFSLTLLVLLVLTVALCVVLTVPAILIMAGLVLLIANHATRNRLAFAQQKVHRLQELEDENEAQEGS